MADKAQIILEGKTYEYPIVMGTEGEKAIDISALRNDTGYITLDPGYRQHGFLPEQHHLHRRRQGHSCATAAFPSRNWPKNRSSPRPPTCSCTADLPNEAQLHAFSERLNKSSLIHEDMLHFFTGYPKGAHPMAILTSVVASLSAFYPVKDNLDHGGRGSHHRQH